MGRVTKVTESNFGFHWEQQGKGSSSGLNNDAGEHFEGKDLEAAVVREMGQNSGDNPANASEPVILEFDLLQLAPDALPGIDDLREHMRLTEEATRCTEGHARLERAIQLLDADLIPTLVVRDYNTTGLLGSENDDDSGLSRLTRSQGRSPVGSQGGSFGLGSSVAKQVSEVSTAFFRTLPSDSDQTVFTGRSFLASHLDSGGRRVVGEGFYLNRSSDDFEYQRPAPEIEGLNRRTEAGTDIIIPAYRYAEDDPHLDRLKQHAIENFMLAIKEQKMVIYGHSGDHHWCLNHETIEDEAAQIPKCAAFFQAYHDESPASTEIEGLGRVSLHIAFNNDFPKKYHTYAVRSPLMKITEKQHRRIAKPYAALLLVCDEKGNDYLRKLENPAHNAWEYDRAERRGVPRREAKQILEKLWAFVFDELRERAAEEHEDEADITGLGAFIPSDGSGLGVEQVSAPAETSDGGDEESATVSGAEAEATEVPVVEWEQIDRTEAGTEDPSGADGMTPSGAGGRGSAEPATPGRAKPGGARSRVKSDIQIRAWVGTGSKGKSVTFVALTSATARTGDVELVALGREGAVAKSLEITSVLDAAGKPVPFAGNVLRGLSMRAGKSIRLEIEMPRRYRIGVK